MKLILQRGYRLLLEHSMSQERNRIYAGQAQLEHLPRWLANPSRWSCQTERRPFWGLGQGLLLCVLHSSIVRVIAYQDLLWRHSDEYLPLLRASLMTQDPVRPLPPNIKKCMFASTYRCSFFKGESVSCFPLIRGKLCTRNLPFSSHGRAFF